MYHPGKEHGSREKMFKVEKQMHVETKHRLFSFLFCFLAVVVIRLIDKIPLAP